MRSMRPRLLKTNTVRRGEFTFRSWRGFGKVRFMCEGLIQLGATLTHQALRKTEEMSKHRIDNYRKN